MIAFVNKNRLFPDPSARMYGSEKRNARPETPDEAAMMRKAMVMATAMERKTPPRRLLENMEVEE